MTKFFVGIAKSVVRGVLSGIIALMYMSTYNYIQAIHPAHALTITIGLFICLGIYAIISLMIDSQPKKIKLSSKIMRVMFNIEVFFMTIGDIFDGGWKKFWTEVKSS